MWVEVSTFVSLSLSDLTQIRSESQKSTKYVQNPTERRNGSSDKSEWRTNGTVHGMSKVSICFFVVEVYLVTLSKVS